MGALTDLVGKARRGPPEAKVELEEHLRPLVHGVLLGWLPHMLAGPQVRGLISDAFTAILSDDGRFVPTLLSRVRAAGQSMQRQRPDAADLPAPDPALREAQAVLARLRKLPERERERLALRLIEGISGPEIAEALAADEREVTADLEKGLALLQEGAGAQVATLKDNAYLWSLTGSPHPVVVRLENLLTPLRYDDSSVSAEREVETNPVGVKPVELTPATGPVPPPNHPEGRRGTSEFKPLSGAGLGAPRKSSNNLGVIASGAPTAIGVDPRRSTAKPVEPTEPSGKGLALPEGDDDFAEERTEAFLDVPKRANPFEQQPGTLAAPNLPAAAQVNPYAGMPGTVAANDLPAAARISTVAGPNPLPPPVPSVPAGKRPTGVNLPQGATAAAPAQAPPVVLPSFGDDDEETGIEVPGALKKVQPESETRQQPALGEVVEHPTRVQPIKAPVHWKSVLFAEDDNEASITLPVPERNRLLRKKGVWRGRAPFAISGMLATVGIAIAWVTIVSSERRATRMWNLVPVSVAATDLSEGSVVSLDKLSTRAVPEQFVTASVVKPDGYGYVVGQKLLVPVQAGDPLLWSDFEMAQATERLSHRVRVKARAISVSTARTVSVGGWVRPGDWVDVIVSLRDGPKGNSRAAVTLVQDVLVIATGKITEKTNYGILNTSQREYQNVSLLLLPEEAEMVTLAKDVGSFHLTLRNDEDHDVHRDGYGSNARTLLDGARVKLLQMRRLATIQSIRDAPVTNAGAPAPARLRIEPTQ